MRVRKNGIEKEVSAKAYRLIYKEQGYEAVDTAESMVEGTGNYDAMKVPDLKALAKKKGIEGCSEMKKEELIAALEAAEIHEEQEEE